MDWNKLENKNKPLEKFSYYFSLDTGQVHNGKFCRFVYTASSGSNFRLTLTKASNAVLQLFFWRWRHQSQTLFVHAFQTSFTHLEWPFEIHFLGQKRGQRNKINSGSVGEMQSTPRRKRKTYHRAWKNFRSNKCPSTRPISERWFCSHWKTPSWKWTIDNWTWKNSKITQHR